ncbi:MAG: response regulator [Ignavibacteriales bacterium]|nr:response regulator [Ignavibacteriales bacterium]
MNMEEMSIDMNMEEISILVIEDNRLLREGIETLLRTQPDMQVVSSLGNGENILSAILENTPKIVLLDLGLRDRSSLYIVKAILKKVACYKDYCDGSRGDGKRHLRIYQSGREWFFIKRC